VATLVIVPGWRDSGPGHWQTQWAEQWPRAVRVHQDDWITPSRVAWIQSLAQTVMDQSGPVVIAAHSLGCIATVNLPEKVTPYIVGALLVAPADPERRSALSDFAPVPHEALPYPSILVATNDDPCCPVRTAGAYARAWGSDFVRLRRGGHLNVESGHGPWPMGLALLQTLFAQASYSPMALANNE
jgi:predicted alpha/beta hydrolase family esterase